MGQYPAIIKHTKFPSPEIPKRLIVADIHSEEFQLLTSTHATVTAQDHPLVAPRE